MENSRNSETILSVADLGRRVREQRKASGLRIDDAASLCNVSVDLLSRLENGRSGISSERLLRVLDGLGLVMLVLDKAKAPRPAAMSPDSTGP